MSMLKDGIEIASFLGIPKKMVKVAVWGTVLMGASVYGTYYLTCAYKEHRSNLDDLHQVLELQRSISIDLATLKTDMNTRMTASEQAINNLSIATQRTCNDEMDVLARLIDERQAVKLLFDEKRKYINQTQTDYLPHLNGFKIGVVPKTN